MAILSAATLERPRVDAQVNARMDSELKHSGDAALAKAGWTPTQAVRALWSFASKHADEPEKVALLFSSASDVAADDIARAERIKRRRELAARGPKLMEEAYRSAGMSWPPDPSPLSNEELKEAAFIDQYGEDFWGR